MNSRSQQPPGLVLHGIASLAAPNFTVSVLDSLHPSCHSHESARSTGQSFFFRARSLRSQLLRFASLARCLCFLHNSLLGESDRCHKLLIYVHPEPRSLRHFEPSLDQHKGLSYVAVVVPLRG